jgi:hypothetical protein
VKKLELLNLDIISAMETYIHLKLGNMQPLKPYKFLQEQVFEGIWVFNKFKSPYNILLLTILYFVWGFALYIIYNIPMYILLAGIFGAISISLWTFGIFHYAEKLRQARVEKLNRVNKKFLVQYLDDLFHPASVVIGVALSTVTNVFLLSPFPFSNQGLIQTIEEELGVTALPPLVLIYIFLIIFDICYRLGLSTYVMLIQMKRNILLSQYIKNKQLKTFFSPVNIKSLENADKTHYMALIGGLFLIPLAILDTTLLIGLFLFLSFAFLTASINILFLRTLYYRAIPNRIVDLLSSSDFAYIGTISRSNMPHVTPTYYVFDGRHVFLTTSIKSKKVINLLNTKSITVCIEHRKDKDLTKSQGVIIQGQARIYGHNMRTSLFFVIFFGIRMLLIRKLFTKKYPHYVNVYKKNNRSIPFYWRTYPILSRTIIEIIPERFIYWKGNKFSRFKF